MFAEKCLNLLTFVTKTTFKFEKITVFKLIASFINDILLK